MLLLLCIQIPHVVTHRLYLYPLYVYSVVLSQTHTHTEKRCISHNEFSSAQFSTSTSFTFSSKPSLCLVKQPFALGPNVCLITDNKYIKNKIKKSIWNNKKMYRSATEPDLAAVILHHWGQPADTLLLELQVIMLLTRCTSYQQSSRHELNKKKKTYFYFSIVWS